MYHNVLKYTYFVEHLKHANYMKQLSTVVGTQPPLSCTNT